MATTHYRIKMNPKNKSCKFNFFEVIKSVLAAAIWNSIQFKIKKKIFKSNKAYIYIIFGFVFTVIFVATLIIVVKTIKYQTGI